MVLCYGVVFFRWTEAHALWMALLRGLIVIAFCHPFTIHFDSSMLCLKQCSRDDITVKMRRDIKALNPVHIANPKTSEFQA